MNNTDKRPRGRWQSAAWCGLGIVLPAAASAALVAWQGSVPNTDIALLIIAAVLVVATSGRPGPAALASLSATFAFDFFHTVPYHSFAIANADDAAATLVLGCLALVIGQIAARAADAHVELVLVVCVAVLSQAVPQPARFLVDHRALDGSLALLVFVTALCIPPAAIGGFAAHSRRMVLSVAVAAVVLPVLSWLMSHLVDDNASRYGVAVVGIAPCEIASVATTSLAGGDTAVAAGMLIASTLVTVAGAGFALSVMGIGGTIDTVGLLVNLAVIVAAPMVVGVVIRSRLSIGDSMAERLERLSLALVILLVWMVASQIELSTSYLRVGAALVGILAGAAVLGVALGHGAPPPVATALLLTTSMRDFAIAAAIAVAAFGPAAAAPLGLYGVLVILWGMIIASRRPAVVARASA